MLIDPTFEHISGVQITFASVALNIFVRQQFPPPKNRTFLRAVSNLSSQALAVPDQIRHPQSTRHEVCRVQLRRHVRHTWRSARVLEM